MSETRPDNPEEAAPASGQAKKKEPEGARRARLGFLFAFLGALCWGFSGTCVSYLTHSTDAGIAAIGTQGNIGGLGVSGIGLLWGIGSAITLWDAIGGVLIIGMMVIIAKPQDAEKREGTETAE